MAEQFREWKIKVDWTRDIASRVPVPQFVQGDTVAVRLSIEMVNDRAIIDITPNYRLMVLIVRPDGQALLEKATLIDGNSAEYIFPGSALEISGKARVHLGLFGTTGERLTHEKALDFFIGEDPGFCEDDAIIATTEYGILSQLIQEVHDIQVASQLQYIWDEDRLGIKRTDEEEYTYSPPLANYVHPSDGGGSIPTALTGANVIGSITVNSLGHVTGTTTRALTPGDIGAATSGHNHTYAQVLTSLTGAGSAASNGQLLIGDGTDFTKATLTQGANVTITNAAGSITIASTDTDTTYGISAETATGGANLRLTGSDVTADDVAIKGSGTTTVTRTDVNTITISSTDNDTTYDVTAPITLSGTTIGHSADDGNLHVPATGTGNNGKVLMAGVTAGSLSWHTLVKADVGLSNVTNDAQVKKAASSTIGNIPTWSVTTGDALGAGYSVETTLTGSATAIARADAVKDYIDNTPRYEVGTSAPTNTNLLWIDTN